MSCLRFRHSPNGFSFAPKSLIASLPFLGLSGSPGRFALPPSDQPNDPCEAGRANRPGEPLSRVARDIQYKNKFSHLARCENLLKLILSHGGVRLSLVCGVDETLLLSLEQSLQRVGDADSIIFTAALFLLRPWNFLCALF